MRKSILKFAFLALLIPLGLISCKSKKNMDSQSRTTAQNVGAAIDHSADKVEEKGHRLVGNYDEALEKAQDRVHNAEEDIRKAQADDNAKAEKRAQKRKRKAENEVEELQLKIKQHNRN